MPIMPASGTARVFRGPTAAVDTLTVDAALRDPVLLSDVLKLAAKYRRQASKTRQVD